MISLALAAAAMVTPQIERNAEQAYILGRCVAWQNSFVERLNRDAVVAAGPMFKALYDRGVADADKPISEQTCERALFRVR